MECLLVIEWLSGVIEWFSGVIEWFDVAIDWLSGVIEWFNAAIQWLNAAIQWHCKRMIHYHDRTNNANLNTMKHYACSTLLLAIPERESMLCSNQFRFELFFCRSP